jgi:hypothetical protein
VSLFTLLALVACYCSVGNVLYYFTFRFAVSNNINVILPEVTLAWRVMQHSGIICVLIGMYICPPLESNFDVHLEDTLSPPNCSWEFIANNVVEPYSNFC